MSPKLPLLPLVTRGGILLLSRAIGGPEAVNYVCRSPMFWTGHFLITVPASCAVIHGGFHKPCGNSPSQNGKVR